MYFPEESNSGLALVRPRILPPLDRHFRPAVLANRAFRELARASANPQPVGLGLEQSDGNLAWLSPMWITFKK